MHPDEIELHHDIEQPMTDADRLAALESENADLKQRLKSWNCGANSCTAYKLEAEVARLNKFGLSDRDYAIVEALAEKQGLSVRKLVLQALRLYQRTIDPVDLGVYGCMGFDDEEVDGE